jgi:hypothetical protein
MQDHEGRRRWEPMVLDTVGTVSDIVLGGGGKLSIVANDQGDVRKPKGLE